jgi:diaminohydroxyphosphoribosylaminopyrimidine deaminase/5-amino-6-(5-phosphoribosylamino)uracil reductase
MDDSRDAVYMRRALTLAERGWGQTAPNPMVGAVVVRDGQIVGEGYHARFGESHAEINALRDAGDQARGATMYVTLEPCTHHGKTPPCADAVIAAGVAHVVVAAPDPTTQAAGGAAQLRAAGVTVRMGVCEREARELNAPFFFAAAGATRPWVTVKLALSIDGAIADATRSRGWLTNDASRAEVQRMRANSDAIAVGVDTAIIDDPSLTVRALPEGAMPRVPPLRVIFDRSHRLPDDKTVVRTANTLPTAIMHEPDLRLALGELHARGIQSLLVEGGAGMTAELLRQDLVDRLVIFQAPIILGRGSLGGFGGVSPVEVAAATRLHVVRRQPFGDDLMTIYALHAV